jgi:N-acetylated-alpha-linked acidic dipeptidase
MADAGTMHETDPELERRLLDAVNLDVPWSVVERFSTLVRSSGSSDERKAIDLLVSYLQSFGVPHTLHEPVCFISIPTSASIRLAETGFNEIQAKTTAMSASTDGKTLSGSLVYIPTKSASDLTDDWSVGVDFGGVDVRGKVVIVDGMAAPARVMDVWKAGALAGIFINPGKYIHESIVTTIWGTPDLDSWPRQPRLPVLSVNRADGDHLISHAMQGLTVQVSTEVDTGWRPIPVLVAEIGGRGNPGEFVLLHGHIDSWHVGVGDNAVGDAAMLELARVFWRHRDELSRSLRIAWWSGHSHGRYAGSTWYADNFATELRNGCVAQVNCDSPGCRWADTYDELTCMSEAIGFLTDTIRDTSGIEAKTDRPARAGDYSFNNIGISSFFMLSSTMSAAERERRGLYPVGGCGGNIEWHTEDDTMAIADRDNLLRDMRVYASSILRTLNSPILPFDWRAVTREFKETLLRYQTAASDLFDFSKAMTTVDDLELALGRFYGVAAKPNVSAETRQRFSEVQRRLARILVPVNYSRREPAFHDPALEVLPLPDLAPALSLNRGPQDPNLTAIIRAHLTRGQNRLLWALQDATALVESAL